MIYGSVCSGIEAATVAWAPLGWKAAFFAEIEPFPRAVLQHHYPDVPLHGDFRTIQAGDYEPIDLLVAGTPCQSFSIAGLRDGLADDRGNLALEYLRLAQRLRPRWILWENVVGVLSSSDGRDFGCFLGGLGELGYGWAYRSLDAQYFGLAQRRQRVFVVGYLGDWRRAAEVLFEPAGLRGDPAPRRETRQDLARPLASCPPGGSGYRNDADTADNLIAHTLKTPAKACTWRAELRSLDVAGSLSAVGDGVKNQQTFIAFGGNNTSGPIDLATAVNAHGGPHGRMDFETETFITCVDARQSDTCVYGDQAGSLDTDSYSQAVAFHQNQRGELTTNDTAGALKTGGGKPGQGYPAVLLGDSPEPTDGVEDVNDAKARSHQALRALREAVDQETLVEWCAGIVAPFWPQEVLRSQLHGSSLRRPPLPQRGLVNVALSRAQTDCGWTVLDLWEAGCDGCPPQGWRPSEQLARELGAYLSRLPYSPSPATRFLHDMWEASEGLGVLREALSTLQEIRRSACLQTQSAHTAQVRRLAVEECEALQGFPRGYSLIPWRGGMAADGPRYKALGNSFAVPVVRWIGQRIAAVDEPCIGTKTSRC